MKLPAGVKSCCCFFEQQHEQNTHPAMLALEKRVLGCDFGGTSWTTLEQAKQMPEALGLAPDSHLLEIGAGTGWPGLYLAGQTGCRVTLLDLPVNSLAYALRRARDELPNNACCAVAASAAALPFQDECFTIISHSDVLCCLPQKLAMLEECRRVARAGARMLFYVITPAAGLTSNEMNEACEVGPPFVGVDDDYAGMLAVSGWQVLKKGGLTAAYLDALRRLYDAMKSSAKSLEPVFGGEGLDAQLQQRARQISAIERGLLVREMYLAKAV